MPQTDLIERMVAWVRARDVVVVFEPGWRTRGVNDAGTTPATEGTWRPVGVLMHHTANQASTGQPAPGRTVLNDGRRNPDGSFLQGPLCHSSGDFDGTIRIHSACRANHGGTARAAGPVPGGSANTLYLGHEINYAGTSPMSPAQRHSAVLWAAAFCAVTSRPATVVRAHAETSVTGKWDPGYAPDKTIDMNAFRADVAAALKEDTMALSDRDIERIASAVAPRVAAAVWSSALTTSSGYSFAAAGWVMAISIKVDSLLDDESTIIAAIHEAEAAQLPARALRDPSTEQEEASP
jgi:N-acetylmuramoyl-L-alanine amidase